MRRTFLCTVAWFVGLGLLGSATWRAELSLVKGWEGLLWLEGFPWAALVGTAGVALCVTFPGMGADARPVRRRAGGLFAVAFLLGLTSFCLAREALYGLYSRSGALLALAGEPALAVQHLAVHLGLLLAAVLLTALGYAAALRWAWGTVRWTAAPRFFLALALVMPLAMISGWALFGREPTDFVHAVKDGTPILWTCVLLGASSRSAVFGRREQMGLDVPAPGLERSGPGMRPGG